ncbi:hypothetical protein K443DRAFT_8695 [Laccaria amethystina LaAM-08-1]|uniref:Uncharacterized protein n=1 Tax=Laccaria amethystina LaAM-08-1 TaxID=1095629 RepID=A0A0C9WNE8_9AGAR|nr:hypothetical protein K443DRAFT_8695 [Laccaria amethystina LaAM-08-1]
MDNVQGHVTDGDVATDDGRTVYTYNNSINEHNVGSPNDTNNTADNNALSMPHPYTHSA